MGVELMLFGMDRSLSRSFQSFARIASRASSPLAGSIALALACACSSSPAAKEDAVAGGVYATPDLAVHALVDAAVSQDASAIDAVLGPEGSEALSSGDPVADRADAERVQSMLAEKLSFDEDDDGELVALLGNDGWSLPFPLVRAGKEWRFDVEDGVREIANRRVGRNEIFTIATLHAYVDAQREYQAESRDGRAPMYAERLLSRPGKHDGLYWETNEGEPESPLGQLIGEAADEGYTTEAKGAGAYHGYRYRVLRSQGDHAPGGRLNYIDAKDNMTGGFAAIAWPAKYGGSGVMTFVVNQRGIVYQKDLGANTEKAAAAIGTFDPNSSWTPTGD